MTSPRRVQKALLIGLDCAVPGRWRKYAEAGLLPVGQRLLADGCFVATCLPAMPTLTTTNWATIATGAWPGTHGITDFNPYRPGDGADDSLQGFDARDVQAEFVWEAAVRAGLDSIVVNWPGSWPPREAPAGLARGRGRGRQPPGRRDRGRRPPGRRSHAGPSDSRGRRRHRAERVAHRPARHGAARGARLRTALLDRRRAARSSGDAAAERRTVRTAVGVARRVRRGALRRDPGLPRRRARRPSCGALLAGGRRRGARRARRRRVERAPRAAARRGRRHRDRRVPAQAPGARPWGRSVPPLRHRRVPPELAGGAGRRVSATRPASPACRRPASAGTPSAWAASTSTPSSSSRAWPPPGWPTSAPASSASAPGTCSACTSMPSTRSTTCARRSSTSG